MDKEDVLKIILSHKDSYVQILKSHSRDFYNDICGKFDGRNFGERLYRWLNVGDTTLGKCKLCGKPTKFLTIKNGFSKFCSKKCSNIVSGKINSERAKSNSKNVMFWETKKCKYCQKEFQSLIKRNQLYCSVKCSTTLTANDKSRIDKAKKTKLERYGSEKFVNSDKAKRTCLLKYGVDNASKSDEIVKRIRGTNLLKYGKEWSVQSEVVKSKIRNSLIKRYGVANAFNAPTIREKIRQTNMVRYGAENVFQNRIVQDKIYKTNLERYGVKIPTQSPELIKRRTAGDLKRHYEHLITSSKILDFVEPLFNIDEYVGTHRTNIYPFKCKKCNKRFKDNIDGGRIPRCLDCYPYIQGYSLNEREIVDYIKSILPNEDIIEGDWTILGNKELDIYIPSKNIAIEYNGLYWHSELGGGKNKRYHLDKTEECQKKNIRLIHIFEDEWLNKQEIVKNRLRHILKCHAATIYARKCEVREIDYSVSSKFLEEVHIQGKDNAPIRIGLFYNNELVAVMTFGALRRSMGSKNDERAYEMYRFCMFKNVIGAAGKLLKYFINSYAPLKIVSYADRRWSDGNLYEKLGFEKVGYTPPNFWYTNDYQSRHYRFKFAKFKLKKLLGKFDNKLSGWCNMRLNGYDRIWDCGNIKYEMICNWS